MGTRESSARRWREAAGDLLLGSSCHGCGCAAWTICAGCRAELSARGPYAARPDPCPLGFPPAWTAGPYDRVAKSLVSAHKERGALGLTRVLGERLALAVLALLHATEALCDPAGPGVATPVVLVPVPSARRAVRARGFDAGLALARAAAGRLPQARAGPLLVPARTVADQSGLGAQERFANLDGAFRVRQRGLVRVRPGERLVVVDDVVTSGASLVEAVRALRDEGVPVLGAATVAATVRRRPALARRGGGV